MLQQVELDRIAETLADSIFAENDTDHAAPPFIAEIIPASGRLPAIYETHPEHPGISDDPGMRAYQRCIFGKSPSVVSNVVRRAHRASLRVERRLLLGSCPPQHLARKMSRRLRRFLTWTFRAFF